MGATYDFSGWATKNDLRCSDGRTIRKNAFKDNDGQTVPLVWNHVHDDPLNVLGHALLENREEGVYAYCSFNDTMAGKEAKELVKHGDVKALSIYANQLQQHDGNVMHGAIKEVSLVLAGANPGALIEDIAHSEEFGDGCIFYNNDGLDLEHADDAEEKKEEPKMATEEKKEKTVEDVFNELTEEQKTVVYAIIGQALEDAGKSTEGDDANMKHNVFEGDEMNQQNVLSHSDMTSILADAKKCGSLREAVEAYCGTDGVLMHDGASNTQTYGIADINTLFPEHKLMNNPPDWIKRDTGWVAGVMSAVHKTPFSRIKSQFANITEDAARAKGYIKGKLKKEEVFTLLKRTTGPTTIYKKQKLDRDDVIDITDFDVVAWIKGEMRMMLDEEIARAILVGDGRLTSDDDHIDESCIRPVWTDADLYTVKTLVTKGTTDEETGKNLIKAFIKNRKEYKGSGNPVFYTTEDVIASLLLITDTNGHFMYESLDKLCTVLRVSKIVPVEVMEGLTRTVNSKTRNLLGIMVNLTDYNVGADKGGAVNMFDDFDIDYNQQKYLIETRCSGALVKPYSAMVFETEDA